MNTARASHTATLLTNGEVLVAGGYSSSTSALSTAELYTPPTDTWTFTGDLNDARYDRFAPLLANGQALVLDGHGDGITDPCQLATAELCNPTTGSWALDGSNSFAGNTGQSV